MYFWIALGSAFGGMGRYWCNELVAARMGPEFPWGTLLVNVAGSLAIGMLAALNASLDNPWLGAEGRAFVMVGLCGGYTTFSAFSLQTLILFNNGDWLRTGGNILLSVLLCLIAVWLGYLAGSGLERLRTG